MKDEKEIRDDEIRIIGNDTPPPQPPVRRLWGWIAFGLARSSCHKTIYRYNQAIYKQNRIL